MIDEAALQALIDKQAIRDAIYAYCRSVDRLDIPLGHNVFHKDSHADYGQASTRAQVAAASTRSAPITFT